MAGPIRTLVAIDGELDQRTLDSVLDDPGIHVVGVLEQQGDLALRSGLEADALLVACNGHAEQALGYVAEATRDRPELPVVVVSGSSANRFLRQAFETGADDVVVLADSAAPGADAFFALQKAIVRRTGASSGEDAAGNLICVLGPKGGTGKTVTSANLGVALATAGYRVVSVDLDLQFGDLGLGLGMQPERTIYDLATSGGTLDHDKVDAYLGQHDCGLRVLLAPTRPEQASAITPGFLRDLYAVLRASYDYVIVDTPPGFTPEVIATIDSSTDVCLVCMLDAPSLKNSRLGLETLQLMGYARDAIKVVLNRADSNVGVRREDATEALGRTADVFVPSHRDVVRSINAGEPLVLSGSRTDAGKAFKTLATSYAGEPADQAPSASGARRRRIFGRT